MTPSTPAASPRTVKGRLAPGRLPPEEQFWVRYSPHHEFPLSSVTSVGLHVLIVVLLVLAGWVAYKLGFGGESRPPDVTAVVLDPGGGGSPTAVKQGDGGAPLLDEAVGTQAQPPQPPPEGVKDLDVGSPDPFKFEPQDNHGRPIRAGASKALEVLKHIDAEGRKSLWNTAGEQGPGSKPGPGQGPGVGPGKGPGKALTERQKRVLRWNMTFSTQNGDDYLRQLRDIKPGGGAILAVPATTAGQYEVIRDLSQRPAAGKVEDMTKIKSIFWIDDKVESVAGLARALGIKTPQYFVAFFPSELEEELARLERAMPNGANEDDIEETRFEVVRTDGGYKARAVSVRLKK